jgi:predicted Fe-Mo cluster-binding NifX family protein
MKIAVSAKGGSINALVDDRFGRCEYFVIVDSTTNRINVISNPGFTTSGGAGPAAAREIAKNGVQTLLTGQVGENAQRALEAAGIQIVTHVPGATVKDAVANYLKQ